MTTQPDDISKHGYKNAPTKTFITMSVPVLLSLIAEPVTGLVDTAFVARLGADPLAALGVGTMVLSSTFWIFNFLAIGTQTETAHTTGAQDKQQTARIASTALMLALAIGLFTACIPQFFLPEIATFMGAKGIMTALSTEYMKYRLIGAPAVLFSMASFGIFRGLQDMRTPLIITTIVNLLNILLDWLLIFGIGPFPALGVSGAGIATATSQYVGMLAILYVIGRHLELTFKFDFASCKRLLGIGMNMIIRTALILTFLLYCTRTATEAGALVGAAHQGIRQFSMFTAMLLHAFASTGQSLTGYFKGNDDFIMVRQAARQTAIYSLVSGAGFGLLMLVGTPLFAKMLVPPEAAAVFCAAWIIPALFLPVNALAYATDGILWGFGDFAFSRNAMCISAIIGIGMVSIIAMLQPPSPLMWIWAATVSMTTIRTVLGCYKSWKITKVPCCEAK